MPDINPVFNQIALMLGLIFPLYIKDIVFKHDLFEILVYIGYHKKAPFVCKRCGRSNTKIHSRFPRIWRCLNMFNYKVFIKMDLPRHDCPICGLTAYQVPWARERSSLTRLFEAEINAFATILPISRVAAMLDITEDKVSRVVNYYVNEARKSLDLSETKILGLDETSSRKGHNYITTFLDMDEKKIIFATEGKDSQTISSFTDELISHNRNPDNISEISIDMSPAFIKGVSEEFPNAAVTFDKFHVIKLANSALDSVRREEVRREPILLKTKYLWLKNPSDLSQQNQDFTAQLAKKNLKTAKAYRYKLALQQIYSECATEEEAKKALKKLIRWGLVSRIEKLADLASSLKEHLSGILRHFTSGLTSALIESMNTRIQEIKRRAHGYPNASHFINMIYLVLGKLKIIKLYGTGNPVWE
jgi:transposase